MPRPKFDAQPWITPYVSEEEVMEIKMAFDLFDLDHGGSIDPKCIHPFTQNSKKPLLLSESKPRQQQSIR